MFKIVERQQEFTDSWLRSDYEKHKGERLSLSIANIILDLRHQNSSFGEEAKLIKEEPYQQCYVNSDKIDEMIELTISVKYKYREYTGKDFGRVLVHKRIISREAYSQMVGVYDREYEAGFEFIKTILPQAVHRVGCYCCYGDGPNIETETETLKNGNVEINFYVDFDFDADEYRGGH